MCLGFKCIRTISECSEESEALKWWALLTDEERLIYCETHHGDERHPHTLTGREIEDIHQIAIS